MEIRNHFKNTQVLNFYTLYFFPLRQAITLFVILCAFCPAVFGQSSFRRFFKKVTILPSGFYTPETRIGMGAFAYGAFKTARNDSLTKKSNVQVFVTYTQNRQFACESEYLLWTPNNRFNFSGYIDYKRFPNYFYGIGNTTNKNNRIGIDYKLLKFNCKNNIQIMNNTYLGLNLHYQKVYDHSLDITKLMPCVELYGKMGYEALGFGVNFIVDKRDNPLNPAKGSYIEIDHVRYIKNAINDFDFSNFVIDLRKYKTLFSKLIWNGSASLNVNEGSVPYLMLPEIGGPRYLRGYYKGRFRDNNLFVLQQELRIPVYKIVGIAFFTGIGAVSRQFSQLVRNELHYNYGAGLRIRVNKKDNSNVRIDYGLTKDSHGLYVVFAEAF